MSLSRLIGVDPKETTLKTFKLFNLARCAVAVLACLTGLAQGQTFPAKPITLVVPWPASGAPDFVARVLSKEMASLLRQPVIVENLPGAGGSLGTKKALSAPADGHTLLLGSPLDLILAPLGYPSASYVPEDARAIAMLGRTDLMLVARKDLGANSLAELVALMKSSADKPLSYCATGAGSHANLIGERLSARAGVTLMAVPYGGMPQCLNDMVGGQIDLAFLPIAGPFPGFVDNGAFKALAVLAESAHRRFPKLPPAQATPGFEGFSVSLWAGVHVSKLVPDAIAEQLNQAVYAALEKPEVRQAFESTGGTVFAPMTLAQAQAAYLKEVRLLQDMAKLTGHSKP
jgi:tripartite-type tricarboxylate transporter receptor subunit TctC